MALGPTAAAPAGFLAYCQRKPDDCGASAADLQAMRLAARSADTASAVAAIRYDWSGVFNKPTVAAPAAITLTYDWSKVFQTAASAEAPSVAASAASAALPPATAQAPPALTPQLWAQITRVNEDVNRAIVRRADIETYGVSEVWATPLADGVNFGDCEDYVLEKRRALMAAGVPAQSLSVAVVSTVRGEHHAVLLVDTQAGEYVLDNLTPWILPWSKTSYQWRERQVAGSPLRWASALGRGASTQPLLLASLR